MNSENITVRPVGREDAADLRENCFSMNTLEEVEERVENTIQMFEEGSGVRFVAEVGGLVVSTAVLRRHSHSLYAHRAEVDDVVVHPVHQPQVARAR